MRPLRFRDLPLYGKFLLPFLALVIVLGALGTFFVVRDLSERAEAELDRTLSQLSLDTRSLLRDRELYILESVNFAANLAGLAEAIERGNRARATRLLRSVLALKTDLDLLVVTDPGGDSFVAVRARANERAAGRTWGTSLFVTRALANTHGEKFAGLVSSGDQTVLAVAGSVCSNDKGCGRGGAAIVGIGVRRLADGLGASAHGLRGGVALYDPKGKQLAATGLRPGEPEAPVLPESGLLRRRSRVDGVDGATLYAPWEVRGRRIGTVAVLVPSGPAFASARGAALKLTLVVLAGMVIALALGALISRFTLSQVKALVRTNRALGRGELSARAPVLGDDELGELARGVNQMAEQLQASRQTLELRVQQRTEEVERLLRERTEFFASLSHELRTPLVTILRQAEVMLDPTYRKADQFTDDTNAIRFSAQELLSLVNDILELARAESGRMDIRLEIVDVADLSAELRPTLEGLARAGDLTLSVDVPSALPSVRADRRRLREVILNLVDNAVKYTPAGGEVAIGASSSDGVVRLSVTDSGVGIPPDSGDRIFEPFFRVHGTETQRGQASSGLGLALSKRLIEAQGGQISFTSEPGRGATFVVTIPIAAETSNGRVAKRARSRSLAGGRSR